VEALRRGWNVGELSEITGWDPFFIHKLKNVVEMAKRVSEEPTEETILAAKRMGFSDSWISRILNIPEREVRGRRVSCTYKMVDTCAGEFEASTPYFYSTYEEGCEISLSPRKKVLIVGSGPIRIGQGIEFDTCCVQGIEALREEGIMAIMINNNPETVSTDFDVSDRLYFEPLTLEDVLNVLEKEEPDGVILQFGGQTSVNLAVPLEEAIQSMGLRTRILGTSADAIDLAEDRERFSSLLTRLNIRQPEAATGRSFEEVRDIAAEIGYPVLVRPSYVLGGRGMEIVHSEEELRRYVEAATIVSPEHPVLVDRYLTHAVEVDVDVVSDGSDVFISGIQEHIEEAGVHSGDAACVIPPQTLSEEVQREIESIVRTLCLEMGIVGLANFQLAVKDGDVYVLEANPRASRTVPYVSKAIGIPLAKIATKVMVGRTLRELGLVGDVSIDHVAVKVPVFPFQKLPGLDATLGPEMKSTGEVMGIDRSLGLAYYKGILAAGCDLPMEGGVYITVRDEDKEPIVPIAADLAALGLKIYATRGTASYLRQRGVEVETVYRIMERLRPDALGLMREGAIKLVINTPTESSGSRRDGYMMRRLAVDMQIPFITTVQAARAAVQALKSVKKSELEVHSLQEYCEQVGWNAAPEILDMRPSAAVEASSRIFLGRSFR